MRSTTQGEDEESWTTSEWLSWCEQLAHENNPKTEEANYLGNGCKNRGGKFGGGKFGGKDKDGKNGKGPEAKDTCKNN